jgi:hypothetical protein
LVNTITEEDIINGATNCGDLKASDIVVRKFNIHMGMKNKNPLEQVSLYNVSQDRKSMCAFNKDPAEISTIVPEKVQSTVVRLFVKDSSKFNEAKNAFQ